jgi:phosphoglycerate kinase
VLKTIDDLAVAGRHVLVRADLNVPLDGGRIWASGRASLFTYGRALGALRRLGQRAGRAPLNAADRGYAVDRVHDRPPDQPNNPEQPR